MDTRTALTRGAAVVLLCTGLAACGGSDDGATWQKVPPPTVEASTDEVVTTDGVLADGRYWGTVERVSGSDDLVFIVARAWFGEACTEWAAERGMEEGCTNDYAVDDVDIAVVEIEDDASVSVAAQMGPGTSYAIDSDTLEDLIAGKATSPIAAYQWTGFPFIVTVSNGVVTVADQYWVP